MSGLHLTSQMQYSIPEDRVFFSNYEGKSLFHLTMVSVFQSVMADWRHFQIFKNLGHFSYNLPPNPVEG